MQNRVEDSVRKKMAELRLVCDREIPIQQQRLDTAVVSSRNSLESMKAKAQATVENHGKIGPLIAQLRVVDDDLVKALAGKNRKEAKRMATMDSISARRARVGELKRILEDQRSRKDEYAAMISQQSEVLAAWEEKSKKDLEHAEEIEEAISWYNRVLGFRIECGHGVKFIFTQVNLKNPSEEYSFTIRHENDIYSLLDCDPPLSETKQLIHGLNKNNGLFKFVRTMREKFQEAAAHGISPQVTSVDQQSSSISLSAPVPSASTDSRSESPSKQKDLQRGEANKHSKKVIHGREGKSAILSPGSASYPRRSPRFKVRK